MRLKLEHFVLYAAILQTEYAAQVSDLDHEIFTTPMTRAIHNAIVCLYSAGVKIDAKVVSAEMARLGHPENFMMDLIDEMSGESLFTKDMNHIIFTLKDMSFREDLKGNIALVDKMVHTSVETKDIIDSMENCISKYTAPSRAFRIENIGDREEFFGTWGYVQTGFIDLDRMLMGLYNSDLITLAARPGLGKTTMAINIMENVIERERKPVIFFSREMCKKQIIARMLSKRTHVDYHSIIQNKMHDYEVKVVDKAWADIKQNYENLLVIDDKTSSVYDICSTARMMDMKQKPGLIIIDYIGLLEAKGHNPNERVTNITNKLKQFAQNNEVPVLALCQLNRMVESRTSKRPQLSDLRDSGSIEQDSNTVIFLYENDEGDYMCDIAKNRAGKTGEVRLRYDKATYNISNYNYSHVEVDA
jgi:replicative DNA helicase